MPRLDPTNMRGSGNITDVTFVATAKMSMVEIIGRISSGGTGPRGIRVLFGEGVWDISPAGHTITGQVELVSLTPGKTIFRRTSVGGAPTAPMLTATGTMFRLQGIQLDDQVGSYPAVKCSTNYCWIMDCVFPHCWRAIEIAGGNGARVQDNLIMVVRSTAYAIIFSGSSSNALCSGNNCQTRHLAAMIYGSDEVSYSTFSCNVSAEVVPPGGSYYVTSTMFGNYVTCEGNVGTNLYRDPGDPVLSG